jgi:hypothetical protein
MVVSFYSPEVHKLMLVEWIDKSQTAHPMGARNLTRWFRQQAIRVGPGFGRPRHPAPARQYLLSMSHWHSITLPPPGLHHILRLVELFGSVTLRFLLRCGPATTTMWCRSSNAPHPYGLRPLPRPCGKRIAELYSRAPRGPPSKSAESHGLRLTNPVIWRGCLCVCPAFL